MSSLQQLAKCGDREVRLTYSAWPDEQQTCFATGGIILREPLYDELGLGHRRTRHLAVREKTEAGRRARLVTR